ncbi:MAG TPA: VCBS repeat-containing protein [Anaerolineales bacterium]|nr:VCBS repeat-containing protein [Anaerolineales bacterium]
MPNTARPLLLLLPLLVLIATIAKAAQENQVYLPLVLAAPETKAVQAPVLKWQRGGCYSSWCETGWYSSPAAADLDGDGRVEVIASAYSIVALDGRSGALEWRVASGHDRSEPNASSVGRTWPGIVLADLDNNGDLEIASAHGAGYLSVYEADGYFAPGWPQRPIGQELRGLLASDLDGDGDLELIATGAVGNQTNTWVYDHKGALLPGWPQLSNDSGYAYGAFNANAAAGDLDGDGAGEIVVPSDVHYINAYERNGAQIPAHAMYAGKGWGKVGVWESPATELRGWGTCDTSDGRAERYRANFAHGPAVIADVDGKGGREVVVTGNVYDCGYGDYPSQYIGLYIFNPDRGRFNAGGYDWRTPPVDTGAPLSEDYGKIENAQPNPALADLDGDGRLEILFASYDGRLHAFWLDKQEHGSWPFAVNQSGEGFLRFASEPAVADLNGDGLAEVIFASWTEKGSHASGKLHILDYLGNALHEVPLPPAFSGNWNGSLAAPTLANLDADADLEVVLNTANSGVVAYDLPGTVGAQVLWGTGRGNTRRDGYLP